MSLEIPTLTQDATYFVRVTGAAVDTFGSYLLTAAYQSPSVLDQVSSDLLAGRGAFGFLSNDEMLGFFRGGERPMLNDDRHQDDRFESSQNMPTAAGYEPNTRFRIVGSISDASDVDHYQFTSPDLAGDQPTVMTVVVTSLDPGRLIPKVTVYDRSRTPLDGQVLANGDGNYTVQIPEVTPSARHFLRLEAAEQAGPFSTGNYRVTVMFGHRLTELETFVPAATPSESGPQAYRLHVAQPQLFHFALAAESTDVQEAAVVVMAVTSPDQQEIYRVAVRPGETRTASSVLLAPGSHLIEVFPLTLDGGAVDPIPYSIRGLSVSEPIAVVPADPTADPVVECPDVDEAFCYPDSMTASPRSSGLNRSTLRLHRRTWRRPIESPWCWPIGGAGTGRRRRTTRRPKAWTMPTRSRRASRCGFLPTRASSPTIPIRKTDRSAPSWSRMSCTAL